jgi:OPA family sugar phosphate sensor protein UhpC-like MFS transporter
MPKEDHRRRWELATVACMYAGYGGLMLCRNAVAIASPAMLRDTSLGFDNTAYGWVLFWGAGGALTGKLVTGVLADVIGGRRLFLLAIAGMVAATMGFGVSSLPFAFAMFYCGANLAKSGGWPAMTKLIAAWFEASRLGRIWGIVSTSSRVSTILAGLLLGALLLLLDWRWLFYIAATITSLFAMGNYWLLKDHPANAGLDPVAAASPPAGTEETPRQSLLETLALFSKSGQVWLICIAIMALTVQMEFVSYLPQYMADNFEIELGYAGMTTAVFAAGQLLSLLLGGWAYDRLSHHARALAFGGLLGLGTLALAVFLAIPGMGLEPGGGFLVAIVATFAFGFAISPPYYLPMSVFSVVFGRSRSGLLVGFIDACGYGMFMVFAPIGARLLDMYGWPGFLKVFAGVSVASIVFMVAFLVGERRRAGMTPFS